MNFNPEIEYQSLATIKNFQEKKLQEVLAYTNANSNYYQSLFKKEKIDSTKIKKIEDLQHIPFTTKENLQRYNKDFICVEPSKIVDYITTSGTLSTPTTFAMTDKDLDRLGYNEAISFTCAGGKPGNIYQLMTTLDKRFMAGFAYVLGIRAMKASVIRVGNGIPELQWDTIQRINPDTIICVPSFILKIIQYAKEHHIDYKKSSVKKAICIGENLRNDDFSLNLLGKKIKEKWDIQLYSTYASTEMSTSFCECDAGKGGHHHPELIICELIDENGNIVKEGEYGELVITTLGVEGMPLIRFKTGDICRFHYEPCSCGRTSMRISPIIGRKNQMIKLKGTTLYPAAIFDILDNIDFIENYLVEVTTNEVGMDDVTVKIGVKEYNEQIISVLQNRFRAKIRVTPHIKIEAIETIKKIQLPEINRKPIKFIDKRK
ncbi:MAG TPA: AMP-binding protein [Bacteroidales bacterium]|jgi:phenylacetate-CoA ligase|nr:phenylacetate--CoA ligase [Bacteroidales bacterium]HOF16988.1 AMP-binding protein [Bacteroidales bacterium]HOR82741.1 AMP-binding protein [Bacteroidales bacterium]HPJ91955.1 AMP-binding protein [Bacteroidales bacterium]HPX59841.1 AMP-binding protein [Bacteroidales bacterium]